MYLQSLPFDCLRHSFAVPDCTPSPRGSRRPLLPLNSRASHCYPTNFPYLTASTRCISLTPPQCRLNTNMARRQKENNKTGSKAPANPKSKHRPPISKGKPANPPTIPSSPASKDKLLAEQKTASSDHLGEHANSTSITAGTSSGTPSSPHGPNQSTDVAAGGTSRTLRKPVEVDLDNIARWKKVKEGNWLPQSARTTKRARERNNEHDLILLMSASKKQKAETNANAQASKQAGKTADSLGPDVGHTAELSTQTSKSFMRPKASKNAVMRTGDDMS